MRRAFPPTVNQTQTVVLALTLLSFALILFRLDGQSLRGDEAFATLFASRPLAEIIAELRLSEPHPPLYYVGLHLWPRLASDSELALRLFSGFFGVLAVPLTYLFAQTLFRRRDLSLVAAALIAVNPYLLWHSRDARMYAPYLAFSLLALVLFARFCRDCREGKILSAVALGVANALALLVHYGSPYLIFGQWVAILGLLVLGRGSRDPSDLEAKPTDESALFSGKAVPRRRNRARSGLLRNWLLSQALTLTLVLPWYISARDIILGRKIEWLAPVPFGAIVPDLLTSFLLGMNARSLGELQPILLLIPLPLLLAGLALSIRSLGSGSKRGREDRLGSWLVTALLIGPLAAILATLVFRSVFVERYYLFLVPLLLVLVARGLVGISRRFWPLGAIAFLLIIGQSLWLDARDTLDPALAKSPDWRGALGVVRAKMEPGDILIVNSPDPSPAYYARAQSASQSPNPWSGIRTITIPDRPLLELADRDRTEAALRSMLGGDQASRAWIVPVRDPAWDRDGLVESWLETNAFALSDSRIGPLRLRLFASPGYLLGQNPRSQPIRFGDSYELLGADLSREGSPGRPNNLSVQPGDPIYLTLYLRATGEGKRENLKVFNHLVEAVAGESKLFAQADGVPGGGERPTSTWRAGEIVLDRYVIRPSEPLAPGEYILRFGLYREDGGERLPARSTDGHFLGDSVEIGRVTVGH